jgi:uncharacterized DUF497 family protein
MSRFEFDPIKSEKNRLKHGIDFLAAQEIWEDDKRIETRSRSKSEERFQLLGRARGRIWAAFVTYRGDAIRIISVRRARIEERTRYEEDQ